MYIYLREILAVELGDQGGQALIISLDSDGVEDLLDVLRRGGGVTTQTEEEVSCEVLHFDGCRGELSESVENIGLKYKRSLSTGTERL